RWCTGFLRHRRKNPGSSPSTLDDTFGWPGASRRGADRGRAPCSRRKKPDARRRGTLWRPRGRGRGSRGRSASTLPCRPLRPSPRRWRPTGLRGFLCSWRTACARGGSAFEEVDLICVEPQVESSQVVLHATGIARGDDRKRERWTVLQVREQEAIGVSPARFGELEQARPPPAIGGCVVDAACRARVARKAAGERRP